MDHLPVSLSLASRRALVVGGGTVAARKVALLLAAGAQVLVASPELGPSLAELAAAGRIEHLAERFAPEHVDGAFVVVAATDAPATNAAVSAAAQARGVLVNVVDAPDLCTFLFPSIVDRSPLVVSVSTSGASPVLARLLRARLETLLPSTYGRLAELARALRPRLKERVPDPARRRALWEELLDGPFAELVLAGKRAEAERWLDDRLASVGPAPARGEVYLVGAGPGNPDLLTFRALRLMQQADVIVYDHLVSPAVVELCRRDADRIYVGKERDHHALRQEEINALLVRLATEGKRVARLKGGDPFIFGRGGEEIATLAEHGVSFEVVPGITAAAGVAAYAGIPLTHRDCSHACVFVTGHLKDGTMNLDWPALARPWQTVVVYMGLHGLPVLCRELIAHGLPADTPAAIIQRGTTHRQRVVTGSLATLPELAVEARMKPPTLIVVGQVVKLRERLRWFDPEGAADVGEWPARPPRPHAAGSETRDDDARGVGARQASSSGKK
ncbi:MAG: uroporphyrinogen-III C-methyltransferase [Polyangiaceae bacterium]|nr:uroporphyrinogen-III C-methyltransferase [Polyangiaceae bacterium]